MTSIVCLVVGFLYFTNLVYEIQTGIGKEIIYTLFILMNKILVLVLLCLLLLLFFLQFAVCLLLMIFYLKYNL